MTGLRLLLLLLCCLTLSAHGKSARRPAAGPPEPTPTISAWPPKLVAPPDAESLALIRKKLADKDEHLERTVRRIGDRTIELDVYVSSEARYDMVQEIFSDIPSFGTWGLRNINKRPTGGEYYVKFNSMDPKPGDPTALITRFALELPVLHRNMVAELRFGAERRAQSFVLNLKSKTESESPIGTIEGYLHFFPADNRENRVWLHCMGHVRLNSSVMYELLPEKLLQRESGDRLRIVLDNFIAEEDRRLALRPKKGKKRATAE